MLVDLGDDFDLSGIGESGQCFRWEEREDGGWRIPFRDRCLRIAHVGGNAFELDCGEGEFRELWRPYFDLDTDYAAIRGRIDPLRDPFLYRAAEAGRGIRILRQDPWEALVSFIISQNRNIPAIRRSVGLLCAAAGEARRDSQGDTFFTFPTPEAVLALGERGLDACRLGYRTGYVLAAARAVSEGSPDLAALGEKTDTEVMTALLELYGVGPKVASCVALFGLHRLDSFPVDVWMRRVLETHYPQGYPLEAYRPWNGVYQQYLFACIRGMGASGPHPRQMRIDFSRPFML